MPLIEEIPVEVKQEPPIDTSGTKIEIEVIDKKDDKEDANGNLHKTHY